MRRLFLAAVVTAIPLVIFAPMGLEGQVVAICITAPAFLIAIVANPNQLRAIIQIFIFGSFGWVFGSMFAPAHLRPTEQANFVVLCVVLAIGLGIVIRLISNAPK